MKAAIIDKTGTPRLPLAALLHDRGHHVVLVSRKDTPLAPGADPVTGFEHHRIGLDDTAQLVTALQHCHAAIVCSDDGLALPPGEEQALRIACERAAVPHLIRLRFLRPLQISSANREFPGRNGAVFVSGREADPIELPWNRGIRHAG